jgi:Spy/CpxP family protein refolding chaperone
MITKTILIAAVAACAVTLGSQAVAQPMDGRGWHHGGGEGMELLHGLNLTDAQKQQAHEIEHAAWAQARPIMAQMHALHEQLATAMLAPGSVTAEQLAPLMTQEEQLRTQMDQQHLNTILQIRALLTPEQIAQASTTHQKLAALHEQEHQLISASVPGDGQE